MSATLLVRLNTGARSSHFLRLVQLKSRKVKSPISLCCRPQGSTSQIHRLAERAFTTSAAKLLADKTSDGSVKVADAESRLPTPEEQDVNDYREKYIPITRQSIIRFLVQEKKFLSEAEQKLYPDFSIALDSAILKRYHGIQEQLKSLFDPINPDKDTIKTREWSRRDKMDNEFWLLQLLEDVMEKANFHELPKEQVAKLLETHQAQEGVQVAVDANRYDVLRFWVLGYEKPDVQLTLTERMKNAILRRSARPPMEFYKRVIVAIRLKKDSKLFLKAFKEVPVQNIEMLLPDGTIQMTTMDKGIMVSSVSIAAAGVLAKLVTVLASVHMDWMLVMTLVTGGIGFRAWSTYKNRRNKYLIEVSRTLYFKNIANNRGLLTLLVDRAEDESFKEALITYSFLLKSRPALVRSKPSDHYPPDQIGGLSVADLESSVETWVENLTGQDLKFDSRESVALLKSLGLLNEKDGKLHVLLLDSACRILPQGPQSVIAAGASETGITDGFDRDEYLENEDEYKDESKKMRKYGWF